MNREILLDESHKLDSRPLDEAPRPKSGKSRLNLNVTILKEKSIGSNSKNKKARKESS
jgi:hypothetical protein